MSGSTSTVVSTCLCPRALDAAKIGVGRSGEAGSALPQHVALRGVRRGARMRIRGRAGAPPLCPPVYLCVPDSMSEVIEFVWGGAYLKRKRLPVASDCRNSF